MTTTIDGDSVDTESLIDGDDSSAWETLRELGYEGGDVLVIGSFGTGDTRALSRSSTGFGNDFTHFQLFFIWDDFIPSNGTAVINYLIQMGDSDAESRVHNETDNENLTTIQADSNSVKNYSSGWVEYTPTTTSSVTEYFPQHRNTAGTSTLFIAPTLLIGVQL